MKKIIFCLALSAFGTSLFAQVSQSPSTQPAHTKDKAVISPAPPASAPAHAEGKTNSKSSAKPAPPTAVPASTSTHPPVKKEVSESGKHQNDKKEKKEKKEKKSKKHDHKEQGEHKDHSEHKDHKDDKVVPGNK